MNNAQVITAAHVVAGATEIVVQIDGTDHAAVLVAIDINADLAYLSIPDPPSSSYQFAEATPGEPATAALFSDGIHVPEEMVIVRGVVLHAEDIYIENEVVRRGFELKGDISAGDSGGALIQRGAVVAIVWARSRTAEGRAWAINPVAAQETLQGQLERGLDRSINPGRCAP